MARKKSSEPFIPFRVRRVAAMCQQGEALCVSLRRSDVGAERVYWFEPSGKPAPPKSAEQAISLGLVIASGDGLFGDSQTYRAA